jgi:hypothetical protein
MRHEPYKQIEYREHIISIFYDENPENPRQWDNLGVLYTAHRRYCPEKELDDHFDIDTVFRSRWEFSERFLREYIALPVYLYDHSSLSVSTAPFSCQWDSGLFGIIAVEVEKVKQEWGWKKLTHTRRKTIEEHLRGEIKTLDDYLTGQVYGYEITPMDDAENIIGSCWGYYGRESLKQIESDCKGIIDEIHRKEAIQRVINYWKYAIQLRLPFPEYQFQSL